MCPQGQGSLVPGLALPGHVVLDAALTVALERKSLARWGVGLLGKGSSQRGRRMPLVSAFAETNHHYLSDLAVVHAGKWRLTPQLIYHEGKVMGGVSWAPPHAWGVRPSFFTCSHFCATVILCLLPHQLIIHRRTCSLSSTSDVLRISDSPRPYVLCLSFFPTWVNILTNCILVFQIG